MSKFEIRVEIIFFVVSTGIMAAAVAENPMEPEVLGPCHWTGHREMKYKQKLIDQIDKVARQPAQFPSDYANMCDADAIAKQLFGKLDTANRDLQINLKKSEAIFFKAMGKPRKGNKAICNNVLAHLNSSINGAMKIVEKCKAELIASILEDCAAILSVITDHSIYLSIFKTMAEACETNTKFPDAESCNQEQRCLETVWHDALHVLFLDTQDKINASSQKLRTKFSGADGYVSSCLDEKYDDYFNRIGDFEQQFDNCLQVFAPEVQELN